MEGASTPTLPLDAWLYALTHPSLVELECPETLLFVSRSSKAQTLRSISLDISRDVKEGDEFPVLLPLGEWIASCLASFVELFVHNGSDLGMSLTLTLGSAISVRFVEQTCLSRLTCSVGS